MDLYGRRKILVIQLQKIFYLSLACKENNSLCHILTSILFYRLRYIGQSYSTSPEGKENE